MTENIKEVYLFDALYGDTEKFSYWLDHQKGKIINIYTEHGGTKQGCENLMADLTGWGIPYYAAKDTEVIESNLINCQLIFIYSALKHDEVVYKDDSLYRFLRASILKSAH